ncbi:hypothetical protein [Candidatus Synechococcus spongiarum]|nr:hypothetical protein [Candidatus Synechococcus spongiarum]
MAPSTPPLPATLINDWLKPAAVVGTLALLLAAFHGAAREIRTTEASLRSKFKAELQAAESRLRADISELRADNRALSQKLDQLLETLLQP